MSLIAVNNIRKEYRNKVVLADVSLQVEKGERVALIGPNGSGKTTLLKIMMDQVEQDQGQVFTSKRVKIGYLSQYLEDLEVADVTALHLEEIDRLEKKLKSLEEKMATLDYEKDDYQPILDKYEKTMASFELLDGYTKQSMIKKTLLGLGLKESALTRPINKLSGGEKMRVALARILINEPDLLVLDEPTNHLDIKAIEWLENYLKKFSGGVLLVSHDRFFLDRVTTRIAELQGGHLTTRKCNYSSYLHQKSQLRDYYLKEQKNIERHIKSEKAMITKLRKYKKIKQSQSREKLLIRYEEKAKEMMMHLKSTENLKSISGPALTFQPIKHLSHEVLTIEHLNKSFDDLHLLKDVDLTIYGGERVAIIGPNGCGKTTLINIFLGLDNDYTGHVDFGKWVDYVYLGQEVSFEDESLSILEYMHTRYEMKDSEIRKHLSKFQFYGDVLNSQIKDLSGGEKVRIILGEMMLKNPHCLILDEPTNHLDLESRIAIEKAILAYKGTIIAVSHDRYYLNKCVDRLIEIKDGHLIDHKGNYSSYIGQMMTEPKTSGLQLEEQIEHLESKMEDHSKYYGKDENYRLLEAKLNHLYELYIN
ncbi:ABC-F family ATP-binding cassette domain-containing protein [Acidaminobacter sp. JC074]|uniref:ABC-F family ATP-binding cassette domain-containing protein n=1 Tax=Acidaminobacter sp. JC074 TaxID=2530199 RepID=UPI001F112BE5|nr:ABC-F family ATP-binding cassette domain-containing protein [Acidaminobacter sp. JC074]MCH4889008.1 ABC-F family ATP-binding cassette domain-containing protein [Acidaminobacter sp. JC074]